MFAITKNKKIPFESGGNSCSRCGTELKIENYCGVYEHSIFHVKGYRCPKCKHIHKDHTPLKVLRYDHKTGIWAMVSRDDEKPLIQDWDPALIGVTSKGGNGGGAL